MIEGELLADLQSLLGEDEVGMFIIQLKQQV
jgi:hypothetical protein